MAVGACRPAALAQPDKTEASRRSNHAGRIYPESRMVRRPRSGTKANSGRCAGRTRSAQLQAGGPVLRSSDWQIRLLRPPEAGTSRRRQAGRVCGRPLRSRRAACRPAGNNGLTGQNGAMAGFIVSDGRRRHPVRSPARADVLGRQGVRPVWRNGPCGAGSIKHLECSGLMVPGLPTLAIAAMTGKRPSPGTAPSCALLSAGPALIGCPALPADVHLQRGWWPGAWPWRGSAARGHRRAPRWPPGPSAQRPVSLLAHWEPGLGWRPWLPRSAPPAVPPRTAGPKQPPGGSPATRPLRTLRLSWPPACSPAVLCRARHAQPQRHWRPGGIGRRTCYALA